MIGTAGAIGAVALVKRDVDAEGESVADRKLSLARDAARALEDAWQTEQEPDLRRIWRKYDPDASPSVLSAMIKTDLQCRRVRGLSIAVADYLDRFPQLQSWDDCVVSLVYEEYCLREENGENLDPEEFCGRYEPWRDSLLSQLRYHRMLSEAIGPAGAPSSSRSIGRKPPKLPRIGDRFEGFRLDSLLGEGGAARVFLARDEELGERRVALKVSADRGREPSIMGRLNHPRIVPVLSVTHARDAGLRGLCMPWQPGLSLDKIIARIDPSKTKPRSARVFRELIDSIAALEREEPYTAVPCPERWKDFPDKGTYCDGSTWIVAEIAEALAHAHAKKILHRDVKPANVLLTTRDGPKLLDFNLADEPEDIERAQSSLRGGTPPYMAPEQLAAFFDDRLWKTVGPPADLHALGLVLRELLTGKRPPLPEISPTLPRVEFARQVALRDPPESPRTIDKSVPRALDAITRKCLATAPADRYQSAEDLAEDLRLHLKRLPLRHATNPCRRELIQNWLVRRRKVLIAAVLVFGTCLAIASPASRATFQHMAVETRLGALRRSVAAEPNSAAPRIELAQALEAAGHAIDADAAFLSATDRPDAVERFGEAISRNPRSATLWTGLGNAVHRKGGGRWIDAEKAFKAALQIDPYHARALYALASIAFRYRHDDELAYSYATRALRSIENNRGFTDRASWLVDVRRRRATYAIHWGESLLLDSPHPLFEEARGHFGNALVDLQAIRENWSDFDSSTKRTTDFLTAKAHYKLGLVLVRLHRDHAARNSLRAAQTDIAAALREEPYHSEDHELRDAIEKELAKFPK